MRDFCSILVGLRLEKILPIEDYVQLYFSDGTILNILNSFRFDPEEGEDLSGISVTSVQHNQKEFIICFDNSLVLKVGLKDSDYYGPEAMTLTKPGEFEMVWQ